LQLLTCFHLKIFSSTLVIKSASKSSSSPCELATRCNLAYVAWRATVNLATSDAG